MLYHTPELSAQEVLRHTQALLEEHLPLNAEGYQCTTDDLFKDERHADGLVFVQIPLALAPRSARHLYRSRFGIATRSRCEGHVRGWTTAKNPAYRFVLSALAFGLLKVWIPLRWRFTQGPRCGGRWLDPPRFPLTRFAKFLQRALEMW